MGGTETERQFVEVGRKDSEGEIGGVRACGGERLILWDGRSERG